MTDVARRVRFVVAGRVQGVGFRAFTRRAADDLGLGGFVRNREDGWVEGEAEGPPPQVAEFLLRLAQGPAFASVSRVDTDELPPTGSGRGFDVRR